MSYHLFIKSGLIGRLHLNNEKFLNFIKEIEEGYHTDVTFHNACHATDVLHCMYYFSTIPNISVNFKDWDLLAMFVAACIHDYDHPGLSNKFLVQIGDPLAILYNDKSVLENHHCAMSFSILFKEQNNFLEHLDKEKVNDFRETVISLVLATDLAEHLQILTLFKKKILNIPKCVQREDKILLMKILIKCADVSNASKDKVSYSKWVDGIMEEFYRQGDREKELNIPLSPFGNRDVPKPNSCQKSFVEFIATPIFE
ncbi:HD-domain/PDEase-like protein, partial [Piromyces finnis]